MCSYAHYINARTPNLPSICYRLALLLEKFDQLRAAGDMLPQARSADGEFTSTSLSTSLVVIIIIIQAVYSFPRSPRLFYRYLSYGSWMVLPSRGESPHLVAVKLIYLLPSSAYSSARWKRMI